MDDKEKNDDSLNTDVKGKDFIDKYNVEPSIFNDDFGAELGDYSTFYIE